MDADRVTGCHVSINMLRRDHYFFFFVSFSYGSRAGKYQSHRAVGRVWSEVNTEPM